MGFVKIGEELVEVDDFKVKFNMVIASAFRTFTEKHPEKFYFAENLNLRFYGNILEVKGDLNIFQTEAYNIDTGEETLQIILIPNQSV